MALVSEKNEKNAAPALRVSRVGKRPVEVPTGVTITLAPGKVTVKGPKGQIERAIHASIELKKDGNAIALAPRSGADTESFSQYQGLTRALLMNLVEGVSKGYAESLDLIGTGYRCDVKGTDLTLALGYSHPIVYKLPASVKARVEILDVGGTKKPRLHLESYDKEMLGQVAARIRSFRAPEPYKGKGVRYVDERVREKAGKAGGKAGAGAAAKK
jgi:large subunit ribosomal protein L6